MICSRTRASRNRSNERDEHDTLEQSRPSSYNRRGSISRTRDDTINTGGKWTHDKFEEQDAEDYKPRHPPHARLSRGGSSASHTSHISDRHDSVNVRMFL